MSEEELKKEKEFKFKDYGDSGRQDLKMNIKDDGAIYFSDMNNSDGGFIYFYPKNAKRLLRILSKEGFQKGKLQFVNSKEFADILEKERFEGIEFGKLEERKEIVKLFYSEIHNNFVGFKTLKKLVELNEELQKEIGGMK